MGYTSTASSYCSNSKHCCTLGNSKNFSVINVTIADCSIRVKHFSATTVKLSIIATLIGFTVIKVGTIVIVKSTIGLFVGWDWCFVRDLGVDDVREVLYLRLVSINFRVLGYFLSCILG